MLRKVVREKVIDWFRSELWEQFVKGLSPDDTVYHAHIYADSVLDPISLSKVVKGYFEQKGLPLQRKIRFLGQGHGFTNIYYVQPKGMAHFELFLRYSPDTVLEPMPLSETRSGRVYEYWDKDYMERYYRQYEYRPVGPEEEREIEAYFKSDAWRTLLAVGRDKSCVHSHAVIETSIHPETILKYGHRALERRHWTVGREVAVVWDFAGFDQCKLTYLLSKPEIVLELELQYEPDAIIRPGPVPVIDIIKDDDLVKSMSGLSYLYLSRDDVDAILNALG